MKGAARERGPFQRHRRAVFSRRGQTGIYPPASPVSSGTQTNIEVPHQVTFVTSHITFGAEIVNAVLINKVLIAFALFGHRLVIKAGGDGVRDKTAVIVVCPARGFVE